MDENKYMTNTKKLVKKIEKKLSGLIATVQADDITGARKDLSAKPNYIAVFEISDIMDLVEELANK
ncbi:MAG: hypothetical protein UT43_C0017G0009 [Parcubacteria group bacterium GW2011_GWC1_39_29]|uniref:Uncharacterized protein n=1 Tax=Candidatus Yanofskybacteria bacterium GW2011_GWD1_39_16 TaxID=1619030 RepID=A0A837HSV4_9BACT|nr:MAG: hypothetical protein UT35_C0002G0008 [Candidatus Yanofskybacteria bacterium GW2011_GWD1_39_16]KKR14738.1 MAG: hypothetical protein UT43_C0017G0009 [Parcubacteria group bacterium GW2011_GWC1_39_29]